MNGYLDAHYRMLLKAITDGRVIPFFGAGVNLCDRPEAVKWQHGQYLPSGAELSAHLAKSFSYPSRDVHDLVRVSQYIATITGSGPLYEELHSLLDADYESLYNKPHTDYTNLQGACAKGNGVCS